uniref:Uncharacterized protein n=1 Tax=Chromera velia CCMP2878 TaxID=1169474 RepID=A0A0G4G3H6_9ALVE|eukprot:Cvel_4110.t1-p1 / transcript=Cvel_4110.t1 / gene=Cvel_4110 / organism=Chromera_velia_CCMP2878 / gene_product=hypothetical protein / transcript_product=hypothetical protein / location=Cvel_scaffold175:57394-58833(+) / protein_length=480 / sequence_SO=supercontig / SO=protein_coding / is_pseudo=false
MPRSKTLGAIPAPSVASLLSVKASPAPSRSPSVAKVFASPCREQSDLLEEEENVSLYGLMQARKQSQKKKAQQRDPLRSPSTDDDDISLYDIMRKMQRKNSLSKQSEEQKTLVDLSISCPPRNEEGACEPASCDDGDVSLEQLMVAVAKNRIRKAQEAQKKQQRRYSSQTRRESSTVPAVRQLTLDERLQERLNQPFGSPCRQQSSKGKGINHQTTAATTDSGRSREAFRRLQGEDENVSLTDLMADKRREKEEATKSQTAASGKGQSVGTPSSSSATKETAEEEEEQGGSLLKLMAQIASQKKKKNQEKEPQPFASTMTATAGERERGRPRRQSVRIQTSPNVILPEAAEEFSSNHTQNMNRRVATRSRSLAFPSGDAQREATDEIAFSRMCSRSPVLRDKARRKSLLPEGNVQTLSSPTTAPSARHSEAAREEEHQKQEREVGDRGQQSAYFKIMPRKYVPNLWRHSRLTSFFTDEQE